MKNLLKDQVQHCNDAMGRRQLDFDFSLLIEHIPYGQPDSPCLEQFEMPNRPGLECTVAVAANRDSHRGNSTSKVDMDGFQMNSMELTLKLGGRYCQLHGPKIQILLYRLY